MAGLVSDAADDILLRPIRLDDLNPFRAMRIEAVRDYPLSFTADLAVTLARTDDAWREQLAGATGDGSGVIMLADAGQRGLAGMAGVFTPPQPKLAHGGVVWGVYVRPPFRGRGVGERLVRACIDWARAKPLVMLRISVVAGNDVAWRCYERCGFVHCGTEPLAVQWDGRFHDEHLLAIRL
jgi:RimJ/RimL family protein N-acetyltransferase